MIFPRALACSIILFPLTNSDNITNTSTHPPPIEDDATSSPLGDDEVDSEFLPAAADTSTSDSCPPMGLVTQVPLNDRVIRTSDSDFEVGPGDMLVWDENPLCEDLQNDCNSTTQLGQGQGYCIGLPMGSMECHVSLVFPSGTIVSRRVDQTQRGLNLVESVVVGGTECFSGASGYYSAMYNTDNLTWTFDLSSVVVDSMPF